MQKRSYFSIYIAIAILVALTVCGSIWDFEIANAIFTGQTPSENIFGIIFSYIGVIPTFVGWSFLGASIFHLSKKQIEDTKKRRWLKGFGILLFVLSFFYFCNTLYMANSNAFKVNFFVAYSIGIATITAAWYLGYKLSQKSENGELLKKVLFLAIVSLVTLIIISATKEIMCRPRFRFVLSTNNADYFRNWWQSGRSIKENLAANSVTDEFSSLPSGHSAYSMFAIFIFPALADYVSKLKKYKSLLFVFGFVWWEATALSHMTIGAHYLTDVTIAGLVTILSYAIISNARKIYLKQKN